MRSSPGREYPGIITRRSLRGAQQPVIHRQLMHKRRPHGALQLFQVDDLFQQSFPLLLLPVIAAEFGMIL